MASNRHDVRFRGAVERRLEPSEAIVATARVWTARPRHLQVLAARFRDDAVVTDRRLMLWECGWWTRRPRRRVLADRFDDIVVTNARASADGTVRRIRVDHAGRPSIILDIARDQDSQRFATALLEAKVRAPA